MAIRNTRIAEFVGGPYDGQRREIPKSEGQNSWTDPTVDGMTFGGYYARTIDLTEDGKALFWSWHPLNHEAHP